MSSENGATSGPSEPDLAAPPEPSTSISSAAAAEQGPNTSSKHFVFGALGLAIGLIIGSLGGAAVGALIVPTVGAASAALTPSHIKAAVKGCNVTGNEWITVGDNGNSISMKSSGDESDGADIADIACVLTALNTPDSVISEIDSTRALDGRPSAQWGVYRASWSYHPDNGLDIVIEVANR
jgi:hypothetical protein